MAFVLTFISYLVFGIANVLKREQKYYDFVSYDCPCE